MITAEARLLVLNAAIAFHEDWENDIAGDDEATASWKELGAAIDMLTNTHHKHVGVGYCRTCGHYGSDCIGEE